MAFIMLAAFTGVGMGVAIHTTGAKAQDNSGETKVDPALHLTARPDPVQAEPRQPGEKPPPPRDPEKSRPEERERERPEPPPPPDRSRPFLPAEAIARLTTGLDSSGNATHIHSVPFSPDGQTLAWADRKDHAIRVWDARTGKEQIKLHGHESYVLCVAYAPSGRTLASGSYDGSIRIWDLITGRTRAVLRDGQRQSLVYTIAFSPDGKTLASGDWNGTIRLWDLATGKLLHTVLGDGTVPGKQTSYVQVVVFSPDGKLLASGGQSSVVQLWDVATGKERSELRKDLSTDEGRRQRVCGVTSLAYSPDGKTLAAARYAGDPSIVLWDVGTGKKHAPIQSSRGSMTVTFSPDGKLLLSASREIRVWELATGQAVLTIPEPAKHCYAIYSASFSPDGKILASGGQDNAVILWDAFGLDRGRRTPTVLAAQDLQVLWSDLTDGDAARAYRAAGALAAVPRQAVPLIRERLRSIPAADPQRIRQLIADLDSKRFRDREKATEELEKLGELVEPALTKVLDGEPSLEVRRRVKELLRKIVPEALRSARAVMVLERVGNEEAQQVLKDLTRGEPQAPLTREVRAALERLTRRATLSP